MYAYLVVSLYDIICFPAAKKMKILHLSLVELMTWFTVVKKCLLPWNEMHLHR